jgi:hypothetical protein
MKIPTITFGLPVAPIYIATSSFGYCMATMKNSMARICWSLLTIYAKKTKNGSELSPNGDVGTWMRAYRRSPAGLRGNASERVKFARLHIPDGGAGFERFSIRERLELMEGTFEIESNPGQGSRFILTLPSD